MDFTEATDALLRRVTTAELAKRLGCSQQSVLQARMKPESVSWRSPPGDWEGAVVSLARQQAAHFLKLAEGLGRQAKHRPAERAKLKKQVEELQKRLAELR